MSPEITVRTARPDIKSLVISQLYDNEDDIFASHRVIKDNTGNNSSKVKPMIGVGDLTDHYDIRNVAKERGDEDILTSLISPSSSNYETKKINFNMLSSGNMATTPKAKPNASMARPIR